MPDFLLLSPTDRVASLPPQVYADGLTGQLVNRLRHPQVTLIHEKTPIDGPVAEEPTARCRSCGFQPGRRTTAWVRS
jgi:hypothetical protein